MMNFKKLLSPLALRLAALTVTAIACILPAAAQPTLIPAPPQEQPVLITVATIHIGNGEVIEKGAVLFRNGKIVEVRPAGTVPAASARYPTGFSNAAGPDTTPDRSEEHPSHLQSLIHNSYHA